MWHAGIPFILMQKHYYTDSLVWNWLQVAHQLLTVNRAQQVIIWQLNYNVFYMAAQL